MSEMAPELCIWPDGVGAYFSVERTWQLLPKPACKAGTTCFACMHHCFLSTSPDDSMLCLTFKKA